MDRLIRASPWDQPGKGTDASGATEETLWGQKTDIDQIVGDVGAEQIAALIAESEFFSGIGREDCARGVWRENTMCATTAKGPSHTNS